MTNISSVNTSVSNETVRKVEKKPTNSSTSVPEEKSNKSPNTTGVVATRITRLFHQAGVTTSKYTKLDEDVGKKLARRRHVKKARQLSNLEKILEKALELSIEQVSDESIDPDWFYSFIDLAENIFSETMQEIWGKIFAVEISKPGTFSLRTLQTLKQLTQRDARIFQNAVSLTTKMKGENSPKILIGYYRKPSFMTLLGLSRKSQQLNLAEHGLPYPDLLTLMDAGLIFNSEIESGELVPGRKNEWRSSGDTFQLAPRRSGLFLNYYKFTATGAELAKLVSSTPAPHYMEKLKLLLQNDFELS
ncbi:TIGR03899 family protein [Alteromonas sp. a30]|uniref:TIGR03899 family protein n=1 Tax=Alteromonas sp. a30 TaxID=2730917 RepID=UPI0022827989|nr:TIGR03899 family protein [Alteromonas sp. a30]MCY7296551.1 TIGR03899 family protein [Alteromonas sp. a30]